MDVLGYSFSLRMLNLDSRVELVQMKYSKGGITCIDDILPIVAKTTLARLTGIDFKRFDRILNKIEKMTMEEMMSMAKVFGWSLDQMIALWKTQFEIQKSKKKILSIKK